MTSHHFKFCYWMELELEFCVGLPSNWGPTIGCGPVGLLDSDKLYINFSPCLREGKENFIFLTEIIFFAMFGVGESKGK